MSVIKQKFTTINGSLDCLDNVLLYCVQTESFFCDDPPNNIKHIKRAVDESEVNPYLSLKNKLSLISNKFDDNKSRKIKKRRNNLKTQISDSFNVDDLHKYIEEKEKDLTELTNKVNDINKRIIEDNNIIEQLTHLKNIDVDLNELFSFEFIKVRFGYFPKDNYERLNNYISNIKNVIFIPSSVEDEFVWGIYFTLAEKAYEVDAIFASLSFSRIHISDRAAGIPAHSLDDLISEVNKLKTEYENLQNELFDYTMNLQEQIDSWEETLNRFSDVFEMKRKVLYNEYGFTLYGWISECDSDKFINNIKQTGNGNINNINVVADDPKSNNSLSPPVVLKNFFLFRPFQNFVEMYGLPSYNEIDPTPLVALTYCLFFGIMFGDIGQGAVLILAGLFMWYVKRMWLGKIVSVIGACSVCMGFVYGNVFGDEELLHGFKPNENINTLLITTVAMGVVMITLCSIVNIINGIRQRRIDKAIFSPNGLLGLILYWSILAVILGIVNISLNISNTVLTVLIIMSVLLLLFASPISRLIERKKDWMPKNKLEFVVENFFELFEVLLSFITNTISFIRIGAFALVHSGMMKVVFLLAATPNGGYNPVILIAGNILVIILEGLIVGIQVLRLEFFELFSRFYEGNGRKINHNLSEKEE